MIRRSRRNIKWPCGICGTDCQDGSVCCDGCQLWYHASCDHLSVNELKIVGKCDTQYLCSSCTYSAGFDGAIARLKSYRTVDAMTKMETIYLKRMPLELARKSDLETSIRTTQPKIDVISATILKKTGGASDLLPIQVSGDGNCLFNALSVAVTGDESASTELRFRTYMEMVCHKRFYVAQHRSTAIRLVSPDYADACKDCSVDGGYSSAWTIHAAATVLGSAITSVYPPVNGLLDKHLPILNTTFRPRGRAVVKKPFVIMWTSTRSPTTKIWTPNHFVPLVKQADRATSTINLEVSKSYADVAKSPPPTTASNQSQVTGDAPQKSHMEATPNGIKPKLGKLKVSPSTSIPRNQTPLIKKPSIKRQIGATSNGVDFTGDKFEVTPQNHTSRKRPRMVTEPSRKKRLEAKSKENNSSDDNFEVSPPRRIPNRQPQMANDPSRNTQVRATPNGINSASKKFEVSPPSRIPNRQPQMANDPPRNTQVRATPNGTNSASKKFEVSPPSRIPNRQPQMANDPPRNTQVRATPNGTNSANKKFEVSPPSRIPNRQPQMANDPPRNTQVRATPNGTNSASKKFEVSPPSRIPNRQPQMANDPPRNTQVRATPNGTNSASKKFEITSSNSVFNKQSFSNGPCPAPVRTSSPVITPPAGAVPVDLHSSITHVKHKVNLDHQGTSPWPSPIGEDEANQSSLHISETWTGMPNEATENNQSTDGPTTLEGAIRGYGKFLLPEEVLHTMMSRQPSSKSVPSGLKENVYFLLDNNDNVSRQQANKVSMYVDDCGAWASGSVKTHNYILMGENLQYVELNDGFYCKVVKRQRVPLDPQPEECNLMTFKRYYMTLKRSNTFRKRVSTATRCPENLRSLKQMAVVEYVGPYPETYKPHGNAKKTATEYVRTKAQIKGKLDDLVKHKMPREVYQEMLLDGTACAPRDLKQVQNERYRANRILNHLEHRQNKADDMQTLLNQFHGHPFMQEIIQTKAKNPSIILYLEDNLHDIKQFCSSNSTHPCVLGVDRTFNLGACYVTILVYHHRNLLRKVTLNHPIMLGAVYLHWDGRYETYHRFFSHIQSKLSGTVGATHINSMVIGSDEEAALTKAIKDCFPDCQQILCHRHLEENVRRFLSDKVGVDAKKQEEVLKHIFGNCGVVKCESLEEYDMKLNEIIDEYSESLPSFVPYLKKVAQKIRKHILIPRQSNKWIPIDWKNNACESMNNILKLSTNWKTLKMPDLVDRIYKIIRVQQLDIRRALYGHGNYQLAPWMNKMYIRPSVWSQKTEEEKQRVYHKFMKGIPERSKTIISTDGGLMLPQTPKSARKPGQKKRIKNSKTLTPKCLF